MNKSAPKSRTIWLALALFGVTLVAYLPAVRGGFVWDDDGHVTRADLQSLDGLRRIWFEVGATQQYYPLLHTAFWVEHRLWGDAVVGYHLVNILLHAAAACLVAAIVWRLLDDRRAQRDCAPTVNGAADPVGPTAGRVGPATGRAYNRGDIASAVPWFAALVFALHPVCVESVAWISEQKNTLSAVFYLGAALIYLDFDRDRRPARYWAALGLFVAALLTKTVTATLPAALLVVFWWRRGRVSWRRDVVPLAPWFAFGATAGLFSAWFERDLIGASGASFSLSALDRVLLAGRVIWFYLGKLVWPADLAFIYPRWTVNSAAWWQYLFPAAALALVAGLVWMARRWRGPLAGFLFFAGTLFPALGFVNVYPFVFSYVADHFQYLACLGVIVPAATGLTLAARRLASGQRLVPRAGAGVLLAGLGALTWLQSSEYRNAETLYRATLARNPTCTMAHNNLGLVLSQIPGRLPEAIAHYEAAIRGDPRNLEAHLNLGEALLSSPGRLDDAIREFETAVTLDPRHAGAHDRLGSALARSPGRAHEALAQFEAAARLNPDSGEIQDHLGKMLLGLPGRLTEAIDHLAAAVRLDPGSADRHGALGSALLRDPTRLPEAIVQFEAVVRLEPNLVEGHYVLGMLLASQPGRGADALAQLEAALRINPGFAPAQEGLERLRAAADH